MRKFQNYQVVTDKGKRGRIVGFDGRVSLYVVEFEQKPLLGHSGYGLGRPGMCLLVSGRQMQAVKTNARPQKN